MTQITIGVDISKDRLDVYRLADGERRLAELEDVVNRAKAEAEKENTTSPSRNENRK